MSNTMIGTTGGHGGHEFSDYLVPADARIKEVHISAGIFVDALQVGYVQAGAFQSLPRIGGAGGRLHVFVLDDDEYITGISGRSGNYVDSVRIHTNKRVSEAFGGHGGEREFTFVAPAGSEVAGFFGRADWYVDALGLYIRERMPVAPVASATEVVSTRARRAAPVAAVVASGAVEASTPKGRKPKAAPASVEIPSAPAPSESAPGKRSRKPKAPAAPAAMATPAAEPAAPKRSRATGKSRAVAVPDLLAEAPPVAVDRTPRPDDLLKVEGIGPAIARLLVENGIFDLADLAATPAERVRELLAAAGNRFRMADPTTWPEQAGYGARGDWEGMAALQASLKAGRRE